MTKYGEAVKYVGKTFLLGKGQTLEDYNAYMKEPGNKGVTFMHTYMPETGCSCHQNKCLLYRKTQQQL